MIQKVKEAVKKTLKAFGGIVPMILGTMLLISLIVTIIPKSFYGSIFTQNALIDSLIGAVMGSISAGNALISYIIGGELLSEGVSLIAVTAFLITWVSVGIVQFPAEAHILGKKFAILRNIVSFILAIIAAILVVLILEVI